MAYEVGRVLRPYMVPPDLGTYTVDDRPNPGCVSFNGPQELTHRRRRDVMPPSWNKGGVPTQDTCRGFDVPFVLAQSETRPLETLATEQGPIKLPFGPVDDGTYKPSTAALEVLPFTDFRMQFVSDRYYR